MWSSCGRHACMCVQRTIGLFGQCVDNIAGEAVQSLNLYRSKQPPRIPVLVCSELSSIFLRMLRRRRPALDQDFAFLDQVDFTAPLGCDAKTSLASRSFDENSDNCVHVLYEACAKSANTFLSVPIDSQSSFPAVWKLLRLSWDLPADVLR